MNTDAKPALAMGEFIPLLAFMISLVALSIDAMLPALDSIGQDLQVSHENGQQLVVSALFLGLAVGQMIFGPLSDSFGRKPAIYGGYVVFVLGCILSIVPTNFETMLAGRVLQGIGAAAPRVVGIALVRDQYQGEAMARIMSFVMGVFILVPALAPAIGQGILIVSHWRMIFVMFLVLAVISWVWFAQRQPETLPPERRAPFSFAVIWAGVVETCRNKTVVGYILAMGMIFGAFIGYLSTAQQMFREVYAITDLFPLYFAALALAIGLSSFINGRLVMRMGMRRLSIYALTSFTLLSILYFPYAAYVDGAPALWLNMSYFALAFLSIGILFGNFNALAMAPLGHIAGVGAAVVSSIATLISVLLGTIIGQLFNGTVLPLVGSFALLGLASLGVMWRIELARRRDLAVGL